LSLIGPEIGLLVRLKEEIGSKFIFTLKDPCHALNLIAKASLEILPKEIMETIYELNNHFSFPQEWLYSILFRKGITYLY